MRHLALPVRDQERSRRFYETYFGFGAQPARSYDDGVLMLYNPDGFSLALGPTDEELALPKFLHFGVHSESPEAVRAFRDRLQPTACRSSRNGTTLTMSASSAAIPTATSSRRPGSRT